MTLNLDHIPTLDGAANYPTWSKSIMRTLQGEGFWGFVEGSDDPLSPFPKIPAPIVGAGVGPAALRAYHEWWQKDAKVKDIIMRCISPVVSTVLPCAETTTARDIWTTLKIHYGRIDVAAQFELHGHTFVKLEDLTGVDNYITNHPVDCTPGPLPIHSPSGAPPSYSALSSAPSPKRLRRDRLNQQQRPTLVPTPLPIHLPSSAPPSHPPPKKLRRHRPNEQQRPIPYPPPQSQPQSHPHSQPQTTEAPAQGHHSQPPNRPPPSRSPSAERQTGLHSLQPARDTRSQSRNPRPATPTRSRSRSPHPHREDDGRRRRAILKDIAIETIAALNNGFVDLSITQLHTELFLESSQELTDWRRARSHNLPSIRTNIEVLPLSTLEGARHLHSLTQPRSKIGVLNFASPTRPGGGFLNGARGQEESIARSSSLYISLTADVARPFYALHAAQGENNAFYTHAMIYSPEVYLFRDDDGGWLDAIPVDIVTSPAVNARKVRRRFPHRDGLEKEIEEAMRERMGRILALFEIKGATSLVLGSFGTEVFQNDVGVVARIWRDLLTSRSARFRTSFRKVLFCIPDVQTKGVYEAALYSRGGGRGLYPDGDGVP